MPQSGFEDGFTVASSGSLDTWVKEVHAKVPGAIEGYIYDQLKLVIKDFFKRTKAWRNFFGPFTVLANDGTICLNPVDANSAVIQVLSVTKNGTPMVPTSVTEVPKIIITETNSKNPSRYYVEPYDTVHLLPVPVIDVENFLVTAALTPRLRDDNRIEQWIIDMHYESIKTGLLARLYEEPGKVYTNVKSAEYWGSKYRSELTRARSIGAQNYKEGPQPWVFPSWSR
jgi:hypothetical protein